MDVRPVSQLSAPRETKLLDELSGRPATLKRVLHGQEYLYSDTASLELDASVIDEIGQALALMAVEREAGGTSEERHIHQDKLRQLLRGAVRATKAMAEQRLLAGDYERANPAALRCLKLSLELHGSGSLDVIPAYLLLAEACMGMGRAQAADDFITSAELQLTGSADAPPDMLARLHMLKGKVCASRGDTSGALRSFAKNVYYTAMSVVGGARQGPEHYRCGPGYYHLAQAFVADGRWEQAMANYDKCVDVWYKSMLGVRGSMATEMLRLGEEEAQQAGKADGSGAGDGGGHHAAGTERVSSTTGLPRLGVVEADEAVEMLRHIEETRVARLTVGHVSVSEVRFTRALVHAARRDLHRAIPLLEAAVETFHVTLGPDHPTTQDASTFLALFQGLQQDRQSDTH